MKYKIQLVGHIVEDLPVPENGKIKIGCRGGELPKDSLRVLDKDGCLVAAYFNVLNFKKVL